MHKVEADALQDEANSSHKSVFIPVFKQVIINGKPFQINGAIKSLDPPCEGEASSHGEHPYTCTNCFRQMRDLKNTLQHRRSGSLDDKANRLGLKGFNKRYARRGEMMNALDEESQRRKLAETEVKELVRKTLSPRDWEECLHQACLNGEDQMLVINLVRLMKSGISARNPMQILILKNLVSKLQKGNNHRYVDLVKDVSGLFKNELGLTNYALLADIFGLAKETTAAKHCSSQLRLEPGLNMDAIDLAANKFKGLPVNEASDGARCLRYLHPRKDKNGNVVLIGSTWSPSVDSWKEEEIVIPRKDATKGDLDDFGALKRLVDGLIKGNRLAKTVSIHNLTCLAALDKPTVINCMWPIQDKGYKAVHLLKYWEALRKACYFDEFEDVRKSPLNLVGYSTDSAGFSLSAAIHLMSPSHEEINEGVIYLGLGLDDECYLAPYYWYLPSIAYLDYDHEQRLFLKNLKYQTRDLTFWDDNGNTTKLATIEHLKNLKHRCQELGLDCGFSSADLLLIYFCDQNSDACERLFTPRIADLLEKYVPGSQGTVLYIRAVHSLLQPFRVPDFGSPKDVQESISCGIYIFRLWKRALELKKLRLHSQAGAKSDPSKRGHFITYGCYATAEVIFSAGTIHQLAMFLHFKGLGPSWACPYNSGTKSTERIIAELQGKTNELQSLDSQPTFGDMLDRSTKVQFNINAKHRLATAGAKVSSSHKRKRLAFAFRSSKGQESYEYPERYSDFKAAQIQAHRRGVNKARALFSKYMPQQCIDLLKENDCWEKPYVYKKPEGCFVVDSPPGKDHNLLQKSFAVINENIDSKCNDDEREADINIPEESQYEGQLHANEDMTIKTGSVTPEDHGDDNSGGKRWKVSKIVDGKETYIHIKQALKLLLPREYVSRCRQKRHWASQYLPGKEPLNPKHDIIKYCNVALKVTHNGTPVYDIGRVEVIESTKDGSDVVSFEKKGKQSVRVRCSLYTEDENDVYFFSNDVILTKWKPPSAIIGAVDLQPITDRPGKYRLQSECKARLKELGFSPRNTKGDNDTKSSSNQTEDNEDATEKDDYYEVDEIVSRRLSKDTLAYEYKVRFKGYGEEDDMWLPSSFFNRPITFESTSKFGRKRKHKLDPDMDQETHNKRKKRQSSSFEKATAKPSRMSKKITKNRKDKGKSFRSSLKTLTAEEQSNNEKANDGNTQSSGRNQIARSNVRSSNEVATGNETRRNVINEKDSFTHGIESANVSYDTTSEVKSRTAKLCEIVHVDQLSSDEESGNVIGILRDVARRDDNFCNSRRTLGYATFPDVDATLQSYLCSSGEYARGVSITDALRVTRLPPYSLIEDAEKEIKEEASSQILVQFPSYGTFNKRGIHILKRFHRLRQLRDEVQFEEKWLKNVFSNMNNRMRDDVTRALLDRVNEEEKYLVSYKNYRITSQELSVMCGERYLSDEIINLLIQRYCDLANEKNQSCTFILLPSFLSVGEVSGNLIRNICTVEDMNEVEVMFLPVHMPELCHWGLVIFSVGEQSVFFDDGYHCQISRDLRYRTKIILSMIHENTELVKFKQCDWKEIQRFKVPMPDQPKAGSGSCGVAVICAVRDICCGNDDHFTWTYQDTSYLRAQLMVELVDLA